MSRLPLITAALCLLAVVSVASQTPGLSGRALIKVRNASGLQMLVAPENTQPTLRIVLPGQVESDRSIEVLFPEHVTVVEHGSSASRQLYLFRPGQVGDRPSWRRRGSSIEYERELPGGIRLVARATLDDDGVRFRYEFTNNSGVKYDMITPVTDPRLTSIFKDVRLERTYVHHSGAFDLLASETPSRLNMPLDQWLPVRYLASFTWPIPAQLIERRDNGIAYYTKSRAVDQPFIATVSADRRWVVASVAHSPGNVWSNPELTCQHVDPQAVLAPGHRAVLKVKILIVRGSLEEAFRRAVRLRESLR